MATRVQAEEVIEYYGRFPRTLEQVFGYRAQLDIEEDRPHAAFTWKKALGYAAVIILLAMLIGFATAVFAGH